MEYSFNAPTQNDATSAIAKLRNHVSVIEKSTVKTKSVLHRIVMQTSLSKSQLVRLMSTLPNGRQMIQSLN